METPTLGDYADPKFVRIEPLSHPGGNAVPDHDPRISNDLGRRSNMAERHAPMGTARMSRPR
jgi:hypothetical protein